jgi:uncharacterized BrkB/YihY/UPF0761 family membrane protein
MEHYKYNMIKNLVKSPAAPGVITGALLLGGASPMTDLWPILIYIGRPSLIGGLALILIAAIGLALTRRHRIADPRDPWKIRVARVTGLLALLPLLVTVAVGLASQLTPHLLEQYGHHLIRPAKAVPGSVLVAAIILISLAARLPPPRRHWYAVYIVACILLGFGGATLLIYVASGS